MASIPRHRRPQVALAAAIALVVLGVGLANGRHDGGRPPAVVEPTVQEPARPDLGGPLTSWVTRIVAGTGPPAAGLPCAVSQLTTSVFAGATATVALPVWPG